MAFTVVDHGAAPKPEKSSASIARQSEYDAYVKQVSESGKVGSYTPDAGETTRSIAHRVTHAAKRMNVRMLVWTAEGSVYFENTDKVATPRKAPASKPADKPADQPA